MLVYQGVILVSSFICFLNETFGSMKGLKWLEKMFGRVGPKILLESWCFTLPKFNSLPLKSYRNPIGKACLPTTIFQGRDVKLAGCIIFWNALMIGFLLWSFA